MKIISWNIRGSGSQTKRRGVRFLICKENPDLVVFQEVRRRTVDRSFIGSVWSSRFKEWILLPSLGSGGGILVVWDTRRVKVVDNIVGDFSVSIEIVQDNSSWWFSGVYGPCRVEGRRDFWDELAGLGALCGENWCIRGDFNVARSQAERNPATRARKSMRLFNELIAELELFDPPLLNGIYTWSNSQVCARLDRFLFKEGWRVCFPFNR